MKDGNRKPALTTRWTKSWGLGGDLALVLGAGPFEALLFGHAVEDYLGAGQDQFAAEGADAGP